VVDNRVAAGSVRRRIAGAAYHVAGVFTGAQAVQVRFELLSFGCIDHIVGIEPESVVAGGAGERRIACRREVVDPGEIEDAGTKRTGDLDRAVGAAGVDDDDLVEEAFRRAQAG
jgi:hypothetical protein